MLPAEWPGRLRRISTRLDPESCSRRKSLRSPIGKRFYNLDEKGRESAFLYLNEVTFRPCLKSRLEFLLLSFRLLRLTSGDYPNQIAFWLLNCNKCMLPLGDIMLVVGFFESDKNK